MAWKWRFCTSISNKRISRSFETKLGQNPGDKERTFLKNRVVGTRDRTVNKFPQVQQSSRAEQVTCGELAIKKKKQKTSEISIW